MYSVQPSELEVDVNICIQKNFCVCCVLLPCEQNLMQNRNKLGFTLLRRGVTCSYPPPLWFQTCYDFFTLTSYVPGVLSSWCGKQNKYPESSLKFIRGIIRHFSWLALYSRPVEESHPIFLDKYSITRPDGVCVWVLRINCLKSFPNSPLN